MEFGITENKQMVVITNKPNFYYQEKGSYGGITQKYNGHFLLSRSYALSDFRKSKSEI